MASKKTWKRRAKTQSKIADDLFTQVTQLAGQLSVVDNLLVSTELPGPTIEAWAQQVRDLLAALVKERGLVSGMIYQAFSEKGATAASGPKIEASDDGEYTFLTDEDAKRFAEGPNPNPFSPAGGGRFA